MLNSEIHYDGTLGWVLGFMKPLVGYLGFDLRCFTTNGNEFSGMRDDEVGGVRDVIFERLVVGFVTQLEI